MTSIRPKINFNVMMRFFLLIIAIFFALTMILPYMWMVINSFRDIKEFHRNPYSFVVHDFTLQAYFTVWTFTKITTFFKNSFIYAIIRVLGQLLLDSLAAYAFARLTFRGRDLLFAMILSTMMLPPTVTLIPMYLLFYSLGLVNTRMGVILPNLANAFGIFLLRQFFLGIPKDLEEAAKIDGCSLLRIYIAIILPLSKPVLITLGLFLFIWGWNDFVWPLVILSSEDLYPLTVGLAFMKTLTRIYWSNIFAASTIATLPVVSLFLVAQKYLIGGIKLAGLKQ